MDEDEDEPRGHSARVDRVGPGAVWAMNYTELDLPLEWTSAMHFVVRYLASGLLLLAQPIP